MPLGFAHRITRRSALLALAAFSIAVPLATPLHSAEPSLIKDNDLIAIVGDSITEQKDYSVVMESYFLMCKPSADLRAMQWGWSGESAPGFRGRIGDLLRFNPTVVTTCYGMNDGGYSPMNPEKASRYRDAQTAIVRRLKEAGVRSIVVGSPGCVDTYTFDINKGKGQAEMYNPVLADLRDIAREVAQKEGVHFANVFDAMMTAMNKAKAKYGDKYYLAGADGFHPGRNGQFVMAYAFLKSLRLDGNIGTITVDLKAGKADATDGHKVLNASADSVEIESSKYPYCFFGDPASPDSTRGVIEFIPFNEELNRFKLIVKNAPAGKLKVTWGTASKEFEASQLAEGINLASEFLDNPFAAQFTKVQQAIREQQNYETGLTKTVLRGLSMARRDIPGEAESIERIATAAGKKSEELYKKAAAEVTPVKHTIRMEAVK